MKKNITACIIVKNEEKHIENCIKSIYKDVNQIVIIDSGSDDSTLNIIRKFDIDIFFYKWNKDFSELRNISLKHAYSDWILILDADEIINLSTLNLDNIKDNIGGLRVKIKNYLDSDYKQFSTHQYTRIFRNDKNFMFEGKIHEQINESIINSNFEIIDSNLEIEHFGYINTTNEKKLRNLDLLENSNLKDDFERLNYADTLFSLKKNEKALNIYRKIENSINLSNYQNEHVKIRIAQIFLKQNKFSDVNLALDFVSDNVDLEGLRKYVLAASLLNDKKIQEAKKLYLELESSQSNLIDKNVISNAINVLNQIKL